MKKEERGGAVGVGVHSTRHAEARIAPAARQMSCLVRHLCAGLVGEPFCRAARRRRLDCRLASDCAVEAKKHLPCIGRSVFGNDERREGRRIAPLSRRWRRSHRWAFIPWVSRAHAGRAAAVDV